MPKLWNLNAWSIWGLCLALEGLVAYGDYATGETVVFFIFYLLPIMLATWGSGRWTGVIFAVLSARIEWEFRYKPEPSFSWVPFWNELMSLTLFLTVVLVLAALREALLEEQRLARTDPLTGAANVRQFQERAELERQRALRSGGPLSLAYLDLDDFKEVNDQKGHLAGDRLLCLLCETIQKEVRATDLLGRLGGDEFALLMPETGRDEAQNVVNRVQRSGKAALQKEGWAVTFSMGVVCFRQVPETADEMIHEADALMYRVKSSGKDEVRLADWRGAGG